MSSLPPKAQTILGLMASTFVTFLNRLPPEAEQQYQVVRLASSHLIRMCERG